MAGCVNRKQQAVIDFQGTQIQVLMEKLGKKRLLLSDDPRCRLAGKAKVLGRKALLEITTIFTPDTILHWHQQLESALPNEGARSSRYRQLRLPGSTILKAELLNVLRCGGDY